MKEQITIGGYTAILNGNMYHIHTNGANGYINVGKLTIEYKTVLLLYEDNNHLQELILLCQQELNK